MLLPHSNMNTPKSEEQLLNLGKGNVRWARLCEAMSVDIGLSQGVGFRKCLLSGIVTRATQFGSCLPE